MIWVKFKERQTMKKYMILFSAALLSFAACNKEVDIQNPAINNEEVVLTFTSERPQLDVDTKTAWDATNSCIIWEAADKIRVGYTLNGNWMGQSEAGTAKFYASKEVTIDDNDGSVGTFLVPISDSAFSDPETSGTYKFYAIYPSGILSGATVQDPTTQSVTLVTAQNPGVNTFDHSTDIMVGVSEAMEIAALPTDPIEISWNRVVAHVDLTFSNMAFDGTEVPTKITLTFNEDAKVAGSFSVNIEDGTIGSGSDNEIVLEGSGLTVSESNIKVWATVLPVSFTSLDVEVKTDKATYVRSITGQSKTFQKNSRNTLKINMATATRSASEQFDWVKKDLSEIKSSDVFVIVGNNGDNYAMSNSNGTSSAPAAVAVTVANNKLSIAPAENIQWTLSGNATDGYTFYPNGTTETWLYVYNNNNGLRVGTNTDKVFKIIDGYLYHVGQSRYVGIYNSQDWRSYTSINNNIKDQTLAFFVKKADGSSKPVPTISFGEPTTMVNVGESVTNIATIDPETLSVTYSSSATAVATVDATGKVTGIAVGKATITASFAGDETYDEASSSYEITVIDPDANDGSAEKPYTVAEAIAKANEVGSTGLEGVYVKGIVSSTGSVNTQYHSVNYYISDDGTVSSSLYIYSGLYIDGADFTDENNLNIGDYVVVCGKLKMYNTTPEIDLNSQIKEIFRAPSFAPDGGSFTTDNLSVEISGETGATIRYTLDGTVPTATTGTVYESAIVISATTTIKAIAVKNGLVTGVVTKTFTKSSGNVPAPETITFADSKWGLENQVQYPDPFDGGHFTITFAGGSNDGKYYTTGSGIRTYGGGTITIASTEYNIAKIQFTWDGNYAPSTDVANPAGYSSSTNEWTGSAKSIVLTRPSGSGHWRLQAVTVTYE